MLTAANSYLVAASLAEIETMKMQWVRVLRPFLMDGKPQTKNAEIEVSAGFAAELRTAKKVEFCDPPKAKASVVQPPKLEDAKTEQAQQRGAK